jgi:hypothetical protein
MTTGALFPLDGTCLHQSARCFYVHQYMYLPGVLGSDKLS